MRYDARSVSVCFVCLRHLRSDQEARLAVHDAQLFARSLGPDHCRVHFLYSAREDLAHTDAKEVVARRYRMWGRGLPPVIGSLVNVPVIAFTVWRLRRDEGVQVFFNVWDHYLLLPVRLGVGFSRAAVWARCVGVPVGSGPGREGAWPVLRRRLGLAIERLSLRAACRVVVISEHLKEVYVGRGVPAEKISVVSTGVDTEHFSPGPPPPADRVLTLVYVGRFHRNKGVHLILGALRRLVDRGHSIQLRLVGFGPELDRLRELVEELGLARVVTFESEVDHRDLPPIYRTSDVGVFPSVQTEGLGKAVLEAQACGLPVVVTPIGALPELAGDGRGVVAAGADEIALADAIARLCDAPDTRRTMGAKGRDFVLREHSLAVVRREYERLLDDVGGEQR